MIQISMSSGTRNLPVYNSLAIEIFLCRIPLQLKVGYFLHLWSIFFLKTVNVSNQFVFNFSCRSRSTVFNLNKSVPDSTILSSVLKYSCVIVVSIYFLSCKHFKLNYLCKCYSCTAFSGVAVIWTTFLKVGISYFYICYLTK